MTTPLKTFKTSHGTEVTYLPEDRTFYTHPVWQVQWFYNGIDTFSANVKESDRAEGGFEVLGKEALPEGMIGLAVRAVETFEMMRDAEDARAVAETQVVPLDELLAIASEAKQHAA